MPISHAMKPMSLERPVARRRGAERSRRRQGLADPFLVSFVSLGALLGLVIGMTMYVRVAMADMRQQDARLFGDTARTLALETDRIFADAALLANEIRPLADLAFDPVGEPEHMIAARRDIAARLLAGPFDAIAVFSPDGARKGAIDVRGPAATAPAGTIMSLPQGSDLLSDRVSLSSASGSGYFVTTRSDRGAIAFTLSSERMSQVLTGVGFQTYIARPDGSVVASSSNADPLSAINSPTTWMSASLSPERFTTLMAFNGKDHTVAASPLPDRNLIVHVVGPAYTIQRLAREQGVLFLSLFGPAFLALTLVISLIQNEWARRDRRVNTSADVVARADIACDILNAGIIDWSTADATVSYSRGWRDLMDPEGREETTNEEIFDWIDRIHEDDRPMVRAGYQCLLDGEDEFVRQSFRVRRSDGVYIQVMEQAVSRTDVAGRARRIVLVQTQM